MTLGYNDEFSGRLILDLETAPIGDAAVYIEPVSAPANYKDPVKIEAYCIEKQAEKLEKAALDPDLCRIVAIGLLPEDAEPQIFLCPDEEQERYALRLAWQTIASHLLVGCNIVAFDVPVLLRRSQYLNVRAPRLQVERFRHPQIVDLFQELSFHGLLDWHSLDFYCQRFAVAGPPDPYTGADIGALVAAGDWTAIEAHNRADLLKTAALAERLGHFRRVEAAVL